MNIKGIDVFQLKNFTDEKIFMARIWSDIFEKIGEAKLREHFKELLSQETLNKFPDFLTKDNLRETLLSLSEDELKSKSK